MDLKKADNTFSKINNRHVDSEFSLTDDRAVVTAKSDGKLDLWINLSPIVEYEIRSLEDLLHQELSKGNPFVSKEAIRLLKSGGKRIRPLFTILFSMLGDSYNSRQAIFTAAAIETMHMATLIHDDTIDNAKKRRGIDTTFEKHGIHTAVYTGDWMFVKSLQLLSNTNDDTPIKSELLNLLAKSLESVCDGELDQYYGRGVIPGISTYYKRIKGKTAAMFTAACISGAKIANLSEEQVKIAKSFGENFGIGFQILDDLIDVESTIEIAGKPVKNDLNEGIITLPVIMACKKSKEYRHKVKAYLENPSSISLCEIRDAAILSEGINMAKKECRKYVDLCYSDLDLLPDRMAQGEIRNILDKVFVTIL